MESRSRGRGEGGVCKVVAIALLVMTLPVVHVIAVQSYFAKSVVKLVTFFFTIASLDFHHSWGNTMQCVLRLEFKLASRARSRSCIL